MTERRTGRLYLEFPGPELVQVIEGGTIVSKGYLDTAGRSEEWHKRLRRLLESDATGESATHTTADVAALVEEIKAKTYDGVKGRFLTLLEALLEVKNLGNSSVGRLVDILLQDIDNQLLAIAGKHVPEITPAMVDEARHQRELCVFDTTGYALVYRARELKEQAEVAEQLLHQFNQKADQKRRKKLFAMLGDPSPETVAAVMAVLESTDKPHS